MSVPITPDPGLKVLLRSCLLADPSDSEASARQNIEALSASPAPTALGPEDKIIWTYLGDFFKTHGHVPSLQTMRQHFSSIQESDVVERLERLAMIKPRTRGDFLSELSEWIEKKRKRELIETLKATAKIISTGVEDPTGRRNTDGKRVLSGVDAAMAYLDAHRPEPNAHAWPEPVPLDEVSTQGLPEFPTECLPAVVRDFVQAVSASTETDAAMSGPLALGILAACVQRSHTYRLRGDWREVSALFVATVAEPGERKSAVVSACMAPVHAWEQGRAIETNDKDKRHQAELTEMKGRAKGAKGADLIDLQVEIADHEDRAPVAPRVATSDATQEALVRLCADQGGSIAIISAEGTGPFSVAGGRYSGDGGTSYDALLSGHAGDRITPDRISRECVAIAKPSISIVVACQLEALRQLAAIPGSKGTGLLARFVYSFPASLVGRRAWALTPIPDAVSSAWSRTVARILDCSMGLSDRATATATDEAAAMLVAVGQELERRYAPGGDLAGLREWASKAHGLVARIAGIWAVVEADTLPCEVIEVSHVRMAAKLLPWLVEHARVAATCGAADPVAAAAKDVLDWLRAHRAPISMRDLHRALRGKSWLSRAADLEPPLRLLAERGWVRVVPAPPTKGRKGSPIVTVRPDDVPTPTPDPAPRRTIRDWLAAAPMIVGDDGIPRGRPPKLPPEAMRAPRLVAGYHGVGEPRAMEDDLIDQIVANPDADIGPLYERHDVGPLH